ncbi:polysaccharide biosynthesis protein [Granulosicoccus sp. 3-233]|uniref:polysaccharide biosynthesis protein n=1 Tax=Granulosicoccus sp. 3-233 TaxID=3417969 RepID=UPI003D3451FD
MSDSTVSDYRRKVLITGGSGTVGQAFIKQYRDEFQFFNVSRNESYIEKLKNVFPDVHSYVSDIQDLDHLTTIFLKVKPDIVIHAAALKHVNFAELNPSRTTEINISGSLNIIKASVRAEVPIVVGISTDKACQPENIYGYSKKIMEQMFLEHYNEKTRFVCTRFANVACSNGSVIPFWIDSARKGESLKLTDSRMNRLMFTSDEAALLIRQSIDHAENSTRPFVLCSRMKSVGMLDLAIQLSAEFGDGGKPEIVGMRPGERLFEILVSQQELPHAFYSDDGRYIVLHSDEFGNEHVSEPLSSLTADYMSESEMRSLYSEYTKLSEYSLKLASSR